MAEFTLPQVEADQLMAMEKHRGDEERRDFPLGGQALSVPLQCSNRREKFILDIGRGRIDLRKVKLQTRARLIVVLVRLDLSGAPHRNPDDEEIEAPHLHVYREGYGDKWAMPLPVSHFLNPSSIWSTYEDFLRYCNVTRPPHVTRGLFE